MAVERYTLTFNTLMRNQPILYNLGRKYRLIVTLEKANLSDEAGWVQVAFNGDADEIQRAIADLNTMGVFVTPDRTRADFLNRLDGKGPGLCMRGPALFVASIAACRSRAARRARRRRCPWSGRRAAACSAMRAS